MEETVQENAEGYFYKVQDSRLYSHKICKICIKTNQQIKSSNKSGIYLCLMYFYSVCSFLHFWPSLGDYLIPVQLSKYPHPSPFTLQYPPFWPGLSHRICVGQRNDSKYYTSRALESNWTVGPALLCPLSRLTLNNCPLQPRPLGLKQR